LEKKEVIDTFSKKIAFPEEIAGHANMPTCQRNAPSSFL
jgi:hypothetical protein